MTDIKLPPLPPLHIVPSVEPVDYPEVAQALIDYARAAVLADRESRQQDELDAARYRWLKQHAFCGVWHRGDGLALVAPRVIQREVDAAIDAAMQRTSGSE